VHNTTFKNISVILTVAVSLIDGENYNINIAPTYIKSLTINIAPTYIKSLTINIAPTYIKSLTINIAPT
jgi:hypothetical protein